MAKSTKKGKKSAAHEIPSQPPRRSPPAAGVNVPRLDSYERLRSRFYEAVLLLLVLGQTRGTRTRTSFSGTQQCIRRRFLTNLCYVCDFQKGGDTTTAIALQHSPEAYTFWVAANIDPSRRIVPFLADRLYDLRGAAAATDETRQLKMIDFKRECLDFGFQRIKKEAGILKLRSKECIKHLTRMNPTEPSDLALAGWLEQFQNVPVNPSICETAYRERKSPFMATLKQKSVEPRYGTNKGSFRSAFKEVRHCIGRLAHHVRTAQDLLDDSRTLSYLLDSFEVRSIPVVPPAPRPKPDNHTTLEGITKRLVSSVQSTQFKELLEAMVALDEKCDVLARMLGHYADKNFAPRVHAEIQVAEHFHAERLCFVDGDRFIACSKPACYCCHLYLRHHPARFVEPETHTNVHRNWGPPLLPQGADDGTFIHQRDILHKMLETMKEELHLQIRERREPLRYQPDSHTGITESAVWDASGGESELGRSVDEDEVDLSSDSNDEPAGQCLSSPSSGSSNEKSFASDVLAEAGSADFESTGVETAGTESDDSGGGVSLTSLMPALLLR